MNGVFINFGTTRAHNPAVWPGPMQRTRFAVSGELIVSQICPNVKNFFTYCLTREAAGETLYPSIYPLSNSLPTVLPNHNTPKDR